MGWHLRLPDVSECVCVCVCIRWLQIYGNKFVSPWGFVCINL